MSKPTASVNRIAGWACVLVSSCASSQAFGQAEGATPPASDRVVVMISVDGLAGFYFDDPKAEMPNIRALAAEGAKGPKMKASVPSVTWPNHATLVTGDHPARHGVVGNNCLDRQTGKPVALILDPVFDKDQIVKVPTIYDIAKGAGLKTAAMGWPTIRNAKTLDWAIPDMKAESLDQFTTPALLIECQAANLWPEMTKPSDEGAAKGKAEDAKPRRKPMTEELLTNIFNMVLEKHRPNLALLHIADVDHDEHKYGPRSPEAYAAIKAADERVGRVWAELKKDYPGKATLFIVSDHGFSIIERSILPNVVLRDAGLLQVEASKVTGGDVRVVTQGGSAMIYILNDAKRAEIAARIPDLFSKVEGVASVIGTDKFAEYGVADPKVDPHSPDIILFAKMGYSFGSTAAGSMSLSEKPELKGTHGHDNNLPDLHAIFVAWGAGIRPGVTVQNVANIDVAPTLAAVMGLPMPGVDGKVLTGALDK
ncbi:MAG: ectonucleotide pyrophosphatase/phosphodiesterase [Phycisphaerales bacterium]